MKVADSSSSGAACNYLETATDFDSLKMSNSIDLVVSTGINRFENLRSLALGTY